MTQVGCWTWTTDMESKVYLRHHHWDSAISLPFFGMILPGAGARCAFVRCAPNLRRGRSWIFSHARDLNASEDRTSLALWGVWGAPISFLLFFIKDPGKPSFWPSDYMHAMTGCISTLKYLLSLAWRFIPLCQLVGNLVQCTFKGSPTQWVTSWRRQNFFRSIFKSLVFVSFLCFPFIFPLFLSCSFFLHCLSIPL